MTQRLAFYDLDRTLTRRPTWTPFLLSTAARRAPWRLVLVPAAVAAAAAHKAGLFGRDRLKEVMHRLLLGASLAPAEVEAIAEAFAARVAASGVPEDARARIAADRAAGYRVVLATAAYRFYAAPLARHLGIADVIATDARIDADGATLARIEGRNCYGPAKLAMIEAWLARQGIARHDAHVRVYTDHASDAPALEWADEPFAVNPHARLRRLAEARGWPVLAWA